MTGHWQLGSWKLVLASSFFLCGAISLSGDCAFAQITPDTTLGSENSKVTSTGAVDSIDGGAIRGANLFHSFREFNVNEGRSAYFSNPAAIENILARVTGTNPSNILGTLGITGGNANLFLINPNGIIFGKNARLDVGGSFVASTASSLNFAGGTQFSATVPQTVPLLSVSVPLGLQFGEGAGRIVNQSVVNALNLVPVGLQVDPGKTLALVGGDVALEGGNLTAEAGRIELAGVGDSSLVSLTPTDQGFALGYEDVQNFRDIQLSQEAYVEASGEGGGNIQVQGKRVTLTDGSGIEAYTAGSRSAGTLTVNASDSVELIGSLDNIFSILNTSTFGSGSGGDLRITTRKLILQGGAYVFSNTSNVGNGGNLLIYAAESVNLIGVAPNGFSSGLFASTRAEGQGGSITIDTGNLQVADGAVVTAKTISTGDAGNITINANTVEAVRGGQIQVVTQGSGRAGNITLNIPNSVTLTGSDPTFFERTKQLAQLDLNVNNVSPDSGLFANTTEGSTGNAGDVVLKTGQLNVRDGAEVSVSNQGIGNAGNIQAEVFDIRLDNQGKFTAGSVSGKGGNIQLQSENLMLLRGNSLISAISGDAGGNGVDGNINIDTKFLVAVPSENSDIVATAFGRSPGSNIQVNAQRIFGAQFRQQQTLESDIVATGLVRLNTAVTNPSPGLVSPPVVPVDTQIAQTCTPGSSQSKSEFVVTGHGGLPPSPDEPLSSDAIQVDWVTLNPEVENRSSPAISTNSTAPDRDPVVEAQGWVIGDNGEVVLTASAPSTTPNKSWQTPAKCHTTRNSS